MEKLILFAALCLAGEPAFAGQATVTFRTQDGCDIEAFYSAPSSGAYIFVNTHGLGSNRHEWASFQETLKQRGFGYLSIDLRGHGGSKKCSGKAVSYRSFTKKDWNDASHDVEAAAAWLGRKKIPAEKMVFCGASIGANLSAKAAAEGAVKPAALALLSPGLEYAGVKSEAYLLGAKVPALIAASETDRYAWKSGNYLAAAAAKAGLRAVFAAGTGGHGTGMFAQPAMMTGIVDWVSSGEKK